MLLPQQFLLECRVLVENHLFEPLLEFDHPGAEPLLRARPDQPQPADQTAQPGVRAAAGLQLGAVDAQEGGVVLGADGLAVRQEVAACC